MKVNTKIPSLWYHGNMKCCGIIAEFNPFHQGHAYIIHEARLRSRCDALAVITTSYYSQRGLPSLMSPAAKTKAALANGADLVLELPFCFGTQGAEQFARYAMEALHQLPIDALCFGSESGDPAALMQPPKRTIDPSTSYHRNQGYHLQPNDILASNYLIHCKKMHIRPIIVQRDPRFESATAIRDAFLNGTRPDETFDTNQRWEAYYPYLRTYLQMTDVQTLSRFFMVDEGIESLLKKNARAKTWEEFLERSVTKKYTKARIQRTCLWIMMQITKAQMQKHGHFDQLILLGMNETGRQLVKNHQAISRFSQLDPFLQEVDLKSRMLYNSVRPDETKRQVIIV